MVFAVVLLLEIKKDKKVREENPKIIKEINDFLGQYKDFVDDEQIIENALSKKQELKAFIDEYLLKMETKKLARLIAESEQKHENTAKREQKQKQKTKYPPTTNIDISLSL